MNGPRPWVLERRPEDRALAVGRPGVATTVTIGRTSTSVAMVGGTMTVVAVGSSGGGVGGGAAGLIAVGGLGRAAVGVALGVAEVADMGDEGQ